MSRISGSTKKILQVTMDLIFLTLLVTGILTEETADKRYCKQEGRLTICTGIFKDEHVPSNVYDAKHLLIQSGDLSHISAKVICSFSLLEILQIQNCTLPPPGSTTFTCLKLKDMIITHSHFTEGHASLIGYNSISGTLSLKDNSLRRIPLELIKHVPAAEVVYLNGNNIDDIDDETLINLPTEIQLKLERNNICIKKQDRFRPNSQNHSALQSDIYDWRRKFLCEACHNKEALVNRCLNDTEIDYNESTMPTTTVVRGLSTWWYFVIGFIIIMASSVTFTFIFCRLSRTGESTLHSIEQGSALSSPQVKASMTKVIQAIYQKVLQKQQTAGRPHSITGERSDESEDDIL